MQAKSYEVDGAAIIIDGFRLNMDRSIAMLESAAVMEDAVDCLVEESETIIGRYLVNIAQYQRELKKGPDAVTQELLDNARLFVRVHAARIEFIRNYPVSYLQQSTQKTPVKITGIIPSLKIKHAFYNPFNRKAVAHACEITYRVKVQRVSYEFTTVEFTVPAGIKPDSEEFEQYQRDAIDAAGDWDIKHAEEMPETPEIVGGGQ